jgi:pyruvate formate lyase activating enzyme
MCILKQLQVESRLAFELPTKPAADPTGVQCVLCSNECSIGEGQRGYCGLRTVRNGRLVHLAGTPGRGLLHWYRDPLPTNCVATWVCEGGQHPGDHNLAVFYESCTANCLFCQNWHFREVSPLSDDMMSAQELAAVATPHTFCACFFGGDPSSQMPHALATAKILARQGVRVCWETNGMQHPKLLDAAVDIALETGGCIKFDLKLFNDDLHQVLVGYSNQRTLENFTRAAMRFDERSTPPLVVASTLLVPEYVTPDQVGKLARFIVSINAKIPYALLAFAPNFYLPNLPCTSITHATQAELAAKDTGLVNVRLGNLHLLGWDYG